MDLTTTKESCILSIDIGTTYLKCSLFDLNLNTISNEVLKVFNPKSIRNELVLQKK